MALLKSTLSESGFTATYWKIESVMLNRRTGQTTITTSLFKDETASNAGKAPVESLSISTASSVFDTQIATSDTLIEAAYEHLKTEPQFSGATDV